jgi:hypothetical protein
LLAPLEALGHILKGLRYILGGLPGGDSTGTVLVIAVVLEVLSSPVDLRGSAYNLLDEVIIDIQDVLDKAFIVAL